MCKNVEKRVKNLEYMSLRFQSSLQPATFRSSLNLNAELQQKPFFDSVTCNWQYLICFR